METLPVKMAMRCDGLNQSITTTIWYKAYT